MTNYYDNPRNGKFKRRSLKMEVLGWIIYTTSAIFAFLFMAYGKAVSNEIIFVALMGILLVVDGKLGKIKKELKRK